MFTNDNTECSTKISIISQNKFDSWLAKQQLFTKNWCLSNNFKGEKLKILKKVKNTTSPNIFFKS